MNHLRLAAQRRVVAGLPILPGTMLRAPSLLHATAPLGRRRWQSSYQPPSQPNPKGSSGGKANPHRAFYASFGYPVLKVFLGALFTYEVLYWAWLKLEEVELRGEKNGEIEALQTQLKDLSDKARKTT